MTELFATKFSQVNGRRSCVSEDNFVPSCVPIVREFLAKDIKDAVINLKDGCGGDGLHAKHWKYLDNNNLLYLKHFYHACLIHSYILQSVLQGVFKPRIKNKFGDKNDSKNYREEMVSSNIYIYIQGVPKKRD